MDKAGLELPRSAFFVVAYGGANIHFLTSTND